MTQRSTRRGTKGRTATDTARPSADPQTPHHQQQQQRRRSPLGTRPESAAPGTAPGTALSGLRPKVSRRVTAQPPTMREQTAPPHRAELRLQKPHSSRDKRPCNVTLRNVTVWLWKQYDGHKQSSRNCVRGETQLSSVAAQRWRYSMTTATETRTQSEPRRNTRWKPHSFRMKSCEV